MSILGRIFKGREDRAALRPLYEAIVREARRPFWYREGGVADTIEGRFEMVTAALSLVLIRLEEDGELGRAPSTFLAELFVDDMDGQLRESGVGDVVVGKHIGRLMSALGGRLGAYRSALADGAPETALGEAVERNLYRGEPAAPEALQRMRGGLVSLFEGLRTIPLDVLLKGRLEP